MRRVSVVGNSGSGKSTLARELAATLGVPHLELDSVFHQPRWEPLPVDEFQRVVAARAAEDGWVIDGNYSSRVQPIIWARADTVIWLDLPRLTVMRQIIGRTLRRAVTRQELWNGNREPLTNFFSLDPEKSVISWAWHNHARYRAEYGAAAAAPANAHLTFIRLAGRGDVGRFLADPVAYARASGESRRGRGRPSCRPRMLSRRRMVLTGTALVVPRAGRARLSISSCEFSELSISFCHFHARYVRNKSRN